MVQRKSDISTYYKVTLWFCQGCELQIYYILLTAD